MPVDPEKDNLKENKRNADKNQKILESQHSKTIPASEVIKRRDSGKEMGNKVNVGGNGKKKV